MAADPKVLEFLNSQLTGELTAINQYFLHAKMQENWGYTKIAKLVESPVAEHPRVQEVLVDRGELVAQDLVEVLDDFAVAFHALLLVLVQTFIA
jgi:bacterioferritin